MFTKLIQANSNVFRLATKSRSSFPSNSFSTANKNIDLSKYDASQTSFFMNESLLLVDRDDKVVGNISKVEGHQNAYNRTGLPHRAFSVFLFNQNNELLLHQRSHKKITFPLLWTNSCCSHPLMTPEEMVEENYLGARNAIRRRVEFELGHDLKAVDDLHFMGKIYYHAECDPTWGEHEIDYCFFIKRDFKPEDFKPSTDEIEEVKWVGKHDILKFLGERLHQKNEQVTPWFGAIMHYNLFQWWDVLINNDFKNFKPSPEVIDLNNYQKPLFTPSANGLKPTIQL